MDLMNVVRLGDKAERLYDDANTEFLANRHTKRYADRYTKRYADLVLQASKASCEDLRDNNQQLKIFKALAE